MLPNLVVDGTLNIEGEVFIPSGATFDDLDIQIALKAPLVSPALTGTPTAPTQSALDNSTKVATTAYVDGKMVRATAVNSTSGTSIDFTGIPSWVKRITVMFDNVSTTGTSNIQVQLGDSGGIENSGYTSTSGAIEEASAGAGGNSTGFVIPSSISSSIISGFITIININNNAFVANGITTGNATNRITMAAGNKTLSAILDRIRITTANGTDAFDAGQINIMYEG